MGKSNETKSKIMKSAAAVFSQKGYAASTTREIAASAGVSEAAMFKYYKNKKGLLHETILDFIEQISLDSIFESVDEIVKNNKEMPTEDLFRKLFKDRYCMIDKNFQMFKMLIIEIQYHEDVRDIFIEKVMAKILSYAKVMSSMLEERDDIRNDLDYRTIIRSFMGVVLLTIVQKKMLPELVVSNEDIDTEIENMVDMFMKGIMKGEKE
ncbi:MAG TPA: TetR/AcrR family transcriptional regulator [Clostridia bacterium]|nr:TetR/AcrR family transcriptional regulator [Clostridia bacterium]